ncbi:MAG: hypothetical protein IPN08_01435 [Bacteroidales bacterium]|nr:hypothetical protein [Bacteroidales bacterium]
MGSRSIRISPGHAAYIRPLRGRLVIVGPFAGGYALLHPGYYCSASSWLGIRQLPE